MATGKKTAENQNKSEPCMKILWASPNTLLDTANGAALAVRTLLRQLSRRGCDVRILGATIFVNPNGMTHFRELWPRLNGKQGQFILYRDGELEHRLMITHRVERRLMLSFEEQLWFDDYCRLLDEFEPDLVFFFDNSLITLLTADEARRRGIPAAVYLAHPKNTGSRWCRDVSLMITDTHATAGLYKARENYDLAVVGTFIDPASYRVDGGTHAHVLFVNPCLEKGAVFVIQLALLMEKIRPDIRFEVVEARSRWQDVLRMVTARMGDERTELGNVLVTPNVPDMRPVYARARTLLVPSVWWDSGPRVIVEAMLNGIPVLGSNSGGIAENIGTGGAILHFPPEYLQPPFDTLFEDDLLAQAKDWIVSLYDDEAHWQALSQAARRAHAEHHDIERNTDTLLQVLEETVARGKPVLPT